ncbi:MAG: acetate--CoA ligase [Flavobacteriales bacterium]|nr:acetate--CoA ligase [Flavobacteriales bacterium]
MNTINSLAEYHSEYKRSIEDPERFWEGIANSFEWKKRWDKVLDWNFNEPNVKWFEGGQLNITENCLDRHLNTLADKVAFHWVPNDINQKGKEITYKELYSEVCKFSNVLLKNGVKKGDRVCLYMPMVPELVIAVLSCARIGAIHSVVFAGFSAQSLSDRINDCNCNLVITADGAYRGAKTIDLKSIVDESLESCSSVDKVIVLERTKGEVDMKEGRDLWWHQEMQDVSVIHHAESMNSEDTLFILYTSGSTGKPKGVVHSTAGYMVYAEYSFRNVFQYQSNDIFWCTADIGWITGHSYIIYGPLLAGATSVMFEGVPTYPDAGRFWDIVDKYKVNIFYTAPTAIRALQAKGLEYVKPYKLNSLKVLGTVGEPINEEAWQWYNEEIGKGKCPIVDTWWQTETGGILISPLAGITPLKPTYATLPLPGVQVCLVDSEGNEIEENGISGNLCIKYPWPSMIRTTYGDHERCRQVYFSAYSEKYFTGDGCKRDEDGYFRITGRVDDVINVSGHRIGTAEVEDAINTSEKVIESAVVGFPHSIKGQGIFAFVIHDSVDIDKENCISEIRDQVSKVIGPIAKPDQILLVDGLPKTRSGKIMRRILRKIASGEFSNMGDTSTLLDPSVVEHICQLYMDKN